MAQWLRIQCCHCCGLGCCCGSGSIPGLETAACQAHGQKNNNNNKTDKEAIHPGIQPGEHRFFHATSQPLHLVLQRGCKGGISLLQCDQKTLRFIFEIV